MKALVLSGGGSKGAWQAGALRYLATSRGLDPTLICGVSVGALNAAYLAMAAPGEVPRQAEGLARIWEGLQTRSVRRHHRPFGFLHGLWRPHLYDSRPLQRLVRRELDPERLRMSGRKLRIGTVSLASGRYELFDEASPQIVDAVLASAAFPAMLEPIGIDGALHTDGGLRDVTPLAAAIDAGATSVDVLLAEPEDVPPGPMFRGRPPSAIRLATRALEILLDEVVENDLQTAQRINELVACEAAPEKRWVEVRVLRPSAPLPGDALDFEPADIRAKLRMGEEDARRWAAPLA